MASANCVFDLHGQKLVSEAPTSHPETKPVILDGPNNIKYPCSLHFHLQGGLYQDGLWVSNRHVKKGTCHKHQISNRVVFSVLNFW